MPDTVELSSLVGSHLLSGVSRDQTRIAYGYGTVDAERLAFILDGVCYVATEDPDDGYRSCLRDVVIGDSGMVAATFSPIAVVATWEEGRRDVLTLRHAETGAIVLEVGTDYSDDYYPWFVADFNPPALGTA